MATLPKIHTIKRIKPSRLFSIEQLSLARNFLEGRWQPAASTPPDTYKNNEK